MAGPLVEEEGILYAELDAERARAQRFTFDPVGHYARPDVFELIVHEDRRDAVTSDGRAPRASATARPRPKTKATKGRGSK